MNFEPWEARPTNFSHNIPMYIHAWLPLNLLIKNPLKASEKEEVVSFLTPAHLYYVNERTVKDRINAPSPLWTECPIIRTYTLHGGPTPCNSMFLQSFLWGGPKVFNASAIIYLRGSIWFSKFTVFLISTSKYWNFLHVYMFTFEVLDEFQ